jgi:hypothetical protein
MEILKNVDFLVFSQNRGQNNRLNQILSVKSFHTKMIQPIIDDFQLGPSPQMGFWPSPDSEVYPKNFSVKVYGTLSIRNFTSMMILLIKEGSETNHGLLDTFRDFCFEKLNSENTGTSGR